MFDSAGFSLFVIAAIVFVGWFAVGTQYNVRRGKSALKWLQEGLPLVGERATVRWLGSSVIELKIAEAKAPFRSAEVLVVLEPRDVPLMWWWAHARGRRDVLIFRSQLRGAPKFEKELGPGLPDALNTLVATSNFDGLSLTRLGVHRRVPNLEVHFLLPKFGALGSARVFSGLRELAEKVAAG